MSSSLAVLDVQGKRVANDHQLTDTPVGLAVRTTCSLLGWDPTTKTHPASVGELNANCEAKIMADNDRTELGPNQRGELWVRGQNIMKGYWRNPAATKETKTGDGWLKTGDIAFVDDQGLFHVVDRKKVS